MLKKCVWMLTLTMVSGAAFAEEQKQNTDGKTSIKIEDAAGKTNKVDGNLDEEITNKKMRAESGSKSKYSMSLAIGYNGSTINKPADAKRPNLYQQSGQEVVSSLNGDISARYRINKNDSVTLGIGVGLVTPLQGDINPNSNQFKVNDPSVTWSRVGQMWGLQNSFGIGVSAGTSKVSRRDETIGSPSASYTFIKSFQNGLSLGLANTVEYYFYDSKPGRNQYNAIDSYGGDGRAEWVLGVFPFLEYELTDKLSFRTVSRYTTWYHLYGMDDKTGFLHETGTQSAGIGISVTRDLYLYPNVQFLWQDLKSDRTNVALSATINMF